MAKPIRSAYQRVRLFPKTLSTGSNSTVIDRSMETCNHRHPNSEGTTARLSSLTAQAQASSTGVWKDGAGTEVNTITHGGTPRQIEQSRGGGRI